MTNKQIKMLALNSYTKDDLDEEKVLNISKFLNRADLKMYIKVLKTIEKRNTVIVTLADIGDKNNTIKEIKDMFKTKKIEIREDKTLLGGIKIEDNDTVYELNLKNTINNIVNFISN